MTHLSFLLAMAKTAFDTLDRYPQGRDVSVVDLVQRSIFLLLLRPDLNDVCRFRSKSEQVVPEQAAQDSTGADRRTYFSWGMGGQTRCGPLLEAGGIATPLAWIVQMGMDCPMNTHAHRLSPQRLSADPVQQPHAV